MRVAISRSTIVSPAMLLIAFIWDSIVYVRLPGKDWDYYKSDWDTKLKDLYHQIYDPVRDVWGMAARTIHRARVKLFLEIFNELSSNGENEVYKQVLVDELMSTGKFWESDALNSISNAIRNREIIEHRPDWYSKRDSRWSY